MLAKLTIIILCGSHLAQCQTSNDLGADVPLTFRLYTGGTFFLWCNLTSHQDLDAGVTIRWFRDGDKWCATALAKTNTTEGECVNRNISIKNVNNPTGTQNFQLSVPMATMNDSGNHSCEVVVSGTGDTIQLNAFTLVFVSERTTTVPEVMTGSPKNETSKPARLSQTAIIGIGAGAGGGVLLVIVITAIVCVKKKGKGNSTTGVNAKKTNHRQSNPLEKNAENLHYADLTLHENPKSSSSTGTGSAKSKTLTVNPGDDRVEYAQVVKQ